MMAKEFALVVLEFCGLLVVSAGEANELSMWLCD